MSWRQRAACAGETTDLFFPIGTSGLAFLQAQEAQRICEACPVRAVCLDWALEAAVEHGIWGGLTEDERRALERRNTRARVRSGSDLVRAQPSAQMAMTGAAISERRTVAAHR